MNIKNSIKKIKEKRKGTWLVFLLILIILFLGYFYYQGNKNDFTLITNGEEYGEFIANGGSEQEYLEWVKELEKQDTYGGETPEETLEMYIQALENKDFELASKYFVLEDQKKEYDELTLLDEDVLSEYISFLKIKNRKSSCDENLNSCQIETFYNGGYVVTADFIGNKETNIWKLESL